MTQVSRRHLLAGAAGAAAVYGAATAHAATTSDPASRQKITQSPETK